jgi:plastocyanin
MRKIVLLLATAAAFVVVPPAAAATTQATITKAGFVPKAVRIDVGDSVTWTNTDTVNHQVLRPNGQVLTPVLKPGDSATFTFATAGVYPIRDSFDGSMKGSVTVEPVAAHTVSMNASASEVVYGGKAALSGVVSSHKAGETVAIWAERNGEPALSQITSVTTGDGGSWSYAARPTIATTYQARWHAVSSSTTLIAVHPLVTLRVLAGTSRFSTRVVAGRSFTARIARFQRRTRSGTWATLMNVRLGSGSLAVFRAHVPHGTSALRVYFSSAQAGPGYLAGFSRTVIYHRA